MRMGRGEGHQGEQKGNVRLRDFSKKQIGWGDGWRNTVPRWGDRAERLRVM